MILHLKKANPEDTPFILIQFANILLIKFKMYRFAAKLSSAAMKLLKLRPTINTKTKQSLSMQYSFQDG